MEVATSLIWFCWAGTMESKEGGGGYCGVSTLPFMEKEKRRRRIESGCCLFNLGLSDQNFMQGCNWWYNVPL